MEHSYWSRKRFDIESETLICRLTYGTYDCAATIIYQKDHGRKKLIVHGYYSTRVNSIFLEGLCNLSK